MLELRRAAPSARVAFALIATYGLLLQAMTGAGAPTRVLLAQGETICAADGTTEQLPTSPHPGHDCGCCILGCVANGFGLLASMTVDLPRRFAEPASWTYAARQAPNSSRIVHFAARGPPRA